ncbi:cohesin subunit SA-1-like [Ctenocephalides felis]|uniref:cohesin subunit SA-1-like n=1 Tax=Ctenocephalides felis TaxID=7515 RepID=UPI000E6E24C1|nr:cohesin subunit SA-1-like [Ctenocephalides felis]
MRQLNLINSTLTMWLALSQMYTDLQTTLGDNKRPDGTVKEFAELKTLARYLSLMLGLDKTKNRDAILELHKAGILFAVDKSGNNKEPPIRLPFLEILSEFSGKLLAPDKKVIFQNLKQALGRSLPNEAPKAPQWDAYNYYRQSLLGSEDGAVLLTPSRTPKRTRNPRKNQGRKQSRKQLDFSSVEQELNIECTDSDE